VFVTYQDNDYNSCFNCLKIFAIVRERTSVGLAGRIAHCLQREQIYWPEEAPFICVLKKNPLVCSTSKHSYKASPVSRMLRCHCVWLGQGFGVFLDLCEKIFFLRKMPEGCLTPRGSSFFIFAIAL
jgi:hypothetical protein